MVKYKSRNGASVSDDFLFYLTHVLLGKFDLPYRQNRKLPMFNRSSKYVDVALKASMISAPLSPERDIMKSLLEQNKNKSATRGEINITNNDIPIATMS